MWLFPTVVHVTYRCFAKKTKDRCNNMSISTHLKIPICYELRLNSIVFDERGRPSDCLVENVKPDVPCTAGSRKLMSTQKRTIYRIPGRNGVEAFMEEASARVATPLTSQAHFNRESLCNSFCRPSQGWFRINDRRPTSPACRSISLPVRRPISS